MSGNAVYMDFEDPDGGRGAAPPGASDRKKRGKADEDARERPIPVVPSKQIALTGDETRRGVSERGRAAANLKVEGFTYAEIADMLDFDSPAEARRAVERVLAALHAPEEYETLRMVAAARAEKQFQRSSAMAGADFLVDPATGEKFPNEDRLRWHQTAGTDLMNWAAIVGAKMPAKVEITAADDQVERLVNEVLARTGHEEILDAEVIDLDVIPDGPAWDDESDADS